VGIKRREFIQRDAVMRKWLSGLCIVTLLGGCVNLRPPGNSDFTDIRSLRDLDGKYQNQGERAGKANLRPAYLSAVVWSGANEMTHAKIDTIEVKMLNDTTVVVRALKSGHVEKESLFVEGQDFEFKSGRIRLKRRQWIMGFERGDVVVGPAYENVELGLDKKGAGKYRNEGGVAGLAFLFLPIAFGGREDVRFVRLPE
jgi:hypothetical protein